MYKISSFGYQLMIKGVTISSQLLIFVILAKYMDIESYAIYLILLSSSAIAVHLILPGITNLQVKVGALGKKGGYLWVSIALVSIVGFCASFLLVPFFRHFYPQTDYSLVFLYFISEIIFLRIVDLYSSSLQGVGKATTAMLVSSLPYWLRSISILLMFLIIDEITLDWVIYCIFLCSLIIMVFVLIASGVREKLSFPENFGKDLLDFTWVGFSIISKNSYSHADKLIIGKYIGFQSVADYSVALRLSSTIIIPVQNYLFTIYPALFQGEYKRAYRGLFYSLVYSVAAGAFLYAIGGYVLDWLFSGKYEGSNVYIPYVAMFPFLIVLSSFMADIATAKGLYKSRAKIQFFLAISNLILNIFLVPIYGPEAAVIVTILCEILMIFFLGYTIRFWVLDDA